MAAPLPHYVDTVIIGNGPSALILSYILHGHIPYYARKHQDSIVHSKLSNRPNLLDLTPDLHAHFASSLRYSTQALPINTLLDTLIRPNADTEVNPQSCLEWKYKAENAISHVAIGETPHAGGQWAENPVSASWDIGTLSYAEMLSLPGYSYSDHLARKGDQPQCDFVRPSRVEVADYFQAYPAAVGIAESVYNDVKLSDVRRTEGGFLIGSHGIRCKHLVLASGIFTVNLQPPPLLEPLARVRSEADPLLVIGSGFSAADIIISTPPNRKIIHIFNWAPDERPSPLRGCHHTAYPEYATVYRQMKLAASGSARFKASRSPLIRRKSNPFFNQRDWAALYEGLPNAEVMNVSREPNSASIKIRTLSGEIIDRAVGDLAYVVGRRGTLDYLSLALRSEVLGSSSQNADTPALISGRTLRAKAETDLEVAPDVFIIGSLAGDSLVRHAVGGCVYAAGRIMGHIPGRYSDVPLQTPSSCCSPSSSPSSQTSATGTSTPTPLQTSPSPSSKGSPIKATSNGINAHEDLHLDRRKVGKAVERASRENEVWADSGWWAGGMGRGIR